MKSFKTLVLVKSIAAAVVASAGIAAPAISHASPDDGMACRTGYSGQAVNGTFECSRVISRVVSLDCPTVDVHAQAASARESASPMAATSAPSLRTDVWRSTARSPD